MQTPSSLDPTNIPTHVAIIMDGNGRWAQKRGLMRLVGHKIGVDSVKNIVETARDLGIKVLTLYAFSTENWNRPASEVSGLMTLLETFLQKELDDMMRNNIRLISIGQRQRLPEGPRRILEKVIAATKDNTGLVLNLALSYGSKNEIVEAARRLATLCVQGKMEPDAIREEDLEAGLATYGLPDPDLLIRTGGEYRLSNFLLWQLSYAELYVTDLPWPDFRTEQLVAAIAEYQNRQRRFGRTGDQVSGQTGA